MEVAAKAHGHKNLFEIKETETGTAHIARKKRRAAFIVRLSHGPTELKNSKRRKYLQAKAPSSGRVVGSDLHGRLLGARPSEGRRGGGEGRGGLPLGKTADERQN